MVDNSELVVERLRHPGCVDANCVKCRAADLIERLEAENARLREAMEPFATLTDEEADRLFGQGWSRRTGPLTSEGFSIHPAAFKAARAALLETPAGK